MDDWDGFYTLIGGTAGTLIGLIFVVITLGMEHAREGDTDRTRLFVTPILVYFASLLIISLAMIPPLSETARALALGLFASRVLGGGLGVQGALRRFERSNRSRDPAHRRAAQELGGNPVHSEPREEGYLRLMKSENGTA
jgi:hypothetical protein